MTTKPKLTKLDKLKAKYPKPYKDFPLFQHTSGQGYWAKKIRGRLHYFGPIEDWQAALTLYQQQREALYLGLNPDDFGHGSGDGRNGNSSILTVEDACNLFLESKERKVESGDMGRRMYEDYKAISVKIIKNFGAGRSVASLNSDDFDRLRAALSKTLTPVPLKNQINRTKAIFKYLYEADYIDKPVRWGIDFAAPSLRVIRVHKSQQPAKLYSAAEIKQLLTAAREPFRTMTLLGINCAFGNTDIAKLTWDKIDFEHSTINMPRSKTGIDRSAFLWPESVAALRALHAKSEKQKRFAGSRKNKNVLVFVTTFGNSWMTDSSGNTSLTAQYRLIIDDCKLHKRNRGFNSLRHTFETIAGNSRDQVAVDWVMGHVSQHISAEYRHGIDPDRVRDVCLFVRDWLFAKPVGKSTTKPVGKSKNDTKKTAKPSTKNRRSSTPKTPIRKGKSGVTGGVTQKNRTKAKSRKT